MIPLVTAECVSVTLEGRLGSSFLISVSPSCLSSPFDLGDACAWLACSVDEASMSAGDATELEDSLAGLSCI